MHDFFYEQSNYKVGASENYLQLDIKVKKKELSKKTILKLLQTKILNYQLKNFVCLKS